MYVPEHFRGRDPTEAVAFMRGNPFAILVSPSEAGPFATHLPLSVHSAGEQLLLRGHVARANPHWRHLEREAECLTIFHGPHSYISPGLYATAKAVPTWNYGAVHVYGSARVFSDHEALQSMLHELIATFEPAYAQQWTSLTEAYRELMLSHIVGFEITATRMEAKFKLSQNRTRGEQDNVISSLGAAEDSAVAGVARLMRDQGLGAKKDTE